MLYIVKYTNPDCEGVQSKYFIADEVERVLSILHIEGNDMHFISTISSDYVIKNPSQLVKVYQIEYGDYSTKYIIAKNPQEAIEGEENVKDIYYFGECNSLEDPKQLPIDDIIRKVSNFRSTVEVFFKLIHSAIFNILKENGKILFEEEPILLEDTLINYEYHDSSNYNHKDLWVESVKLEEYNHIILEGYVETDEGKMYIEYDYYKLTREAMVYLFDKIIETRK